MSAWLIVWIVTLAVAGAFGVGAWLMYRRVSARSSVHAGLGCAFLLVTAVTIGSIGSVGLLGYAVVGWLG